MEWFNVGKVINTHGVRGEMKILPITDFVEERFQEGQELYLHHENVKERKKVVVERSRSHKQFILLTLREIGSMDEAEMWKGGMLEIPENDLSSLEEGEYYYYEIIGCSVYTEDFELLGEVREILSPGANDVWVVAPIEGDKDILVPYIEDIVKDVDVKNKRIVIKIMEGLLP